MMGIAGITPLIDTTQTPFYLNHPTPFGLSLSKPSSS